MVEGEQLITLYYGKDVSSQKAESLCGQIRSLYPGSEVELYSGGQKYRYYIISVE
jgi:dihydroxyacetone kinase-like predicted kinase